ncbi:MAG: hypothetical protein CM15mP106_7140 [Candidatus Neomarinimicrobiota bacterium]|nr:MAG: hypothetical protein CM15mP106_7140 [Candidatus Neomarinimicrobiota bacterium]
MKLVFESKPIWRENSDHFAPQQNRHATHLQVIYTVRRNANKLYESTVDSMDCIETWLMTYYFSVLGTSSVWCGMPCQNIRSIVDDVKKASEMGRTTRDSQ